MVLMVSFFRIEMPHYIVGKVKNEENGKTFPLFPTLMGSQKCSILHSIYEHIHKYLNKCSLLTNCMKKVYKYL